MEFLYCQAIFTLISITFQKTFVANCFCITGSSVIEAQTHVIWSQKTRDHTLNHVLYALCDLGQVTSPPAPHLSPLWNRGSRTHLKCPRASQRDGFSLCTRLCFDSFSQYHDKGLKPTQRVSLSFYLPTNAVTCCVCILSILCLKVGFQAVRAHSSRGSSGHGFQRHLYQHVTSPVPGRPRRNPKEGTFNFKIQRRGHSILKFQ